MAVDASELESFARDLGQIPARLVPKVSGVVAKGALNVKNQLRKEARGSSHFKQIAPTITYDLKKLSFAGDGVIEADIGPAREAGPAASLAGIAYFGSSKPGGGTLPDPILALQAEEPGFIRALEDIVEGVLGD